MPVVATRTMRGNDWLPLSTRRELRQSTVGVLHDNLAIDGLGLEISESMMELWAVSRRLVAGEDVDIEEQVLAQERILHLAKQRTNAKAARSRRHTGLPMGKDRVHCPVESLARVLARTDVHAPTRWRTNGPLSMMNEVAEAFGCRSGDPMVRRLRVRIW